MTLNQLFHNGKPHSAAFHLVAGLKGLEHTENAVVEHGRDARPVIRDDEFRGPVPRSRIDPDMTVREMVMVLDRIADQVLQHLGKRCARGPEPW